MDLTIERREWLKEYIMVALKKRMVEESQISNETVQDIIKELKGHIKALPLKDSKGVFPLKKHKGDVEIYGLMDDDISAVDRVELGYKSETLRAKTKNKTTFVASAGFCDLHYVENGANRIHKLKPSDPIGIEALTPFALSSNGSTCRVFLIKEGL